MLGLHIRRELTATVAAATHCHLPNASLWVNFQLSDTQVSGGEVVMLNLHFSYMNWIIKLSIWTPKQINRQLLLRCGCCNHSLTHQTNSQHSNRSPLGALELTMADIDLSSCFSYGWKSLRIKVYFTSVSNHLSNIKTESQVDGSSSGVLPLWRQPDNGGEKRKLDISRLSLCLKYSSIKWLA